MFRGVRGWLVATCIAAGVGCAGGDSETAGLPGMPNPASSTAGTSTTGAPETTDDDADSNEVTTQSEPDPSTGDLDDDTTTSGAASSSSEDTQGAETGTTTGAAGLCTPDNTCASATAIGGVAGDEDSPNVTETGTEPTWVVVQVSEQSSSVVGEELTVTITLQSLGGDFDMNAFLGPAGGSSACGGEPQSSGEAGAPDSVRYEWGEGAVANNDDDGAFVAVEIVAKDAMCVPGSSWTLTAIGDS